MEILCHRGLWVNNKEQNKLVSFKKALENGFGVELDVRDMNSDIVISHDPHEGKNALLLEEFFQLYKSYTDSAPWIAINVKADGLIPAIKNSIESHQIENYYTFDMSIPEMVIYSKSGLKFFTRKSDVEKTPILLEKSTGVWLDSFESEWFSRTDLKKIFGYNKKICVVSPELHGRRHLKQWELVKQVNHRCMMICTDKPLEASEYFNG